jgi:hypothetical protein
MSNSMLTDDKTDLCSTRSDPSSNKRQMQLFSNFFLIQVENTFSNRENLGYLRAKRRNLYAFLLHKPDPVFIGGV